VKSSHAQHQLSAAQSNLLAGQLLSPETPLCNMALSCAIHACVDPTIMQQAWDHIASNCDALGIRIVIGDEQITQSSGHTWPKLDLLDCSAQSNPQQFADSWMQENVATAIQPESVLGSVALIKIEQSHWVFYCNLHHVICDATSFASLWKALSEAYFSLLQPSIEAGEKQTQGSEFLSFVDATAQLQAGRTSEKPEYVKKLEDIAPPAPYGCRPGRAKTASTRVVQTLDDKRLESLRVLSALPQARGFGPGIGHCSVLLTILSTLNINR